MKLLKSIRLNNILSFGPDTKELPLENLNVFIGPNGSGKSNFIEAISLLKAAPTDIAKPIRDGGGIYDWLRKGANKFPLASITALVYMQDNTMNIRHDLAFIEVSGRFVIFDENIEDEFPNEGQEAPYFYYKFNKWNPVINPTYTKNWGPLTRGFLPGDNDKNMQLNPTDIDIWGSILSQFRASDLYPEITYLGKEYSKIKIYREWSFGRNTPPRLPQKADMPNEFLEEDCSNLGLILNKLRGMPETKDKLLKALHVLYEEVTDYDVQIEGGTVQVFLQEGNIVVPATRLSDGTLRYLCLLAILLHPKPPGLICIEEPELGLHPDAIPTLAKLIKDASERTQLIITTHSPDMIDELTEMPQKVVVCEKHNGSTEMNRLDAEDLKVWLDKYRLGQYWRSGGVGGNRW